MTLSVSLSVKKITAAKLATGNLKKIKKEPGFSELGSGMTSCPYIINSILKLGF